MKPIKHNAKRIDMTGKKFGELIVTNENISENGRIIWKCICSCGQEKWILTSLLNAGRRKSCGCLIYKERTKRESSLIPYRLLQRWRLTAERRGLKFDITSQDIEDKFIKQDGKCALTGKQLKLPLNSADVRCSRYNISIDRIDNNIHYTKSNIQIVDKKVNFVRGNLSIKDFVDLCKSVCNNAEKLDNS